MVIRVSGSRREIERIARGAVERDDGTLGVAIELAAEHRASDCRAPAAIPGRPRVGHGEEIATCCTECRGGVAHLADDRLSCVCGGVRGAHEWHDQEHDKGESCKRPEAVRPT